MEILIGESPGNISGSALPTEVAVFPDDPVSMAGRCGSIIGTGAGAAAGGKRGAGRSVVQEWSRMVHNLDT